MLDRHRAAGEAGRVKDDKPRPVRPEIRIGCTRDAEGEMSRGFAQQRS
jgi:hypothetical protein